MSSTITPRPRAALARKKKKNREAKRRWRKQDRNRIGVHRVPPLWTQGRPIDRGAPRGGVPRQGRAESKAAAIDEEGRD